MNGCERRKYIVEAKCGHVGRGHYIPIKFAVTATSKKEAAKKTRDFPRVKHHHKDAILFCKEASDIEFFETQNRNNEDAYLLCHSRSEQRLRCDLQDRIIPEIQLQGKVDKGERKERVKYKLKKYKIMDMYSKSCLLEEEYPL